MKSITPQFPQHNPPDPQNGDYISRERAMWEMLNGGRYFDGKATLRDVMDSIPAADVAPVIHAKWVRPVPGDGDPYCSMCGKAAPLWGGIINPEHWYPDFCPFCGARMDAK